jgi:hypothetical protein
VLGLIVLIRTFLSFSLEVEIEGTLPWRRALGGGAGLLARTTAGGRGRTQDHGVDPPAATGQTAAGEGRG